MEVFLLLLIISRCAEVDVLWLDFMGVQLLIQSWLFFFPYLNAIYSLTSQLVGPQKPIPSTFSPA